MKDKIAIISDIHGNLEALKSVLKDIKKRKISYIICTGDIIAKGMHDKECLKLVRNNCNVVLSGNCDEYYSKDFDLANEEEIEKKRILWNKDKLSDKDREYLSNLPYCYECYISGRLVRLFHAGPNKLEDFAGNIDTIEKLYNSFLPSTNTVSNKKADIVIYGHIHTQFVQKLYNRTIINAGSVGNSIDVIRNDEKDGDVRNTTVANYLVIYGNMNSRNMDEKISYELVSIPYDIEKELSQNSDNIEFEEYKEELKNGKYREMEKIYKYFKIRGIDKEKI